MRTTIAAIVSAYIVSPLLCVPFFLAFSIQPTTVVVDGHGRTIRNPGNLVLTHDGARNATIYVVNVSKLGKAEGNLLININFWVYSIVIKLIPCAALTELSRRLIFALLETKRRRQQLIAASGPAGKQTARSSRVLEKERQTDRTTAMLLAVLLLFLLTEFPQGILGLLSVCFGENFFKNCYLKSGEVMDILALINSAINFILYCAMSRQFRSTFSALFRPSMLDRWLLVPQHNGKGDNNGCTTANNMTQVTQV
jgi:Serpentine type 7TM GPCR chemoreceptor Srw.